MVEREEEARCDELLDGVGVEALIYLRRRTMHDRTAVLLSFVSSGYVLGWPMDPHHGRCLGVFFAVSSDDESFGAAAVTDDNEFLITADSNGYVKARSALSAAAADADAAAAVSSTYRSRARARLSRSNAVGLA